MNIKRVLKNAKNNGSQVINNPVVIPSKIEEFSETLEEGKINIPVDKVLSDELKNFLDLCDDAKNQYQFFSTLLDDCNKKTNNFMHALELEDHDYAARAKLATEQKNNLIERRVYKVIVEEYAHLTDWLELPDTIRAINTLKQVLGGVRKTENYHKNGKYRKRVLSDLQKRLNK